MTSVHLAVVRVLHDEDTVGGGAIRGRQGGGALALALAPLCALCWALEKKSQDLKYASFLLPCR